MNYPPSYHAAINNLVAFGSHRYAERGRRLCAIALLDLRRISKAAAQHERRHMLFISGQFPVKGA